MIYRKLTPFSQVNNSSEREPARRTLLMAIWTVKSWLAGIVSRFFGLTNLQDGILVCAAMIPIGTALHEPVCARRGQGEARRQEAARECESEVSEGQTDELARGHHGRVRRLRTLTAHADAVWTREDRKRSRQRLSKVRKPLRRASQWCQHRANESATTHPGCRS